MPARHNQTSLRSSFPIYPPFVELGYKIPQNQNIIAFSIDVGSFLTHTSIKFVHFILHEPPRLLISPYNLNDQTTRMKILLRCTLLLCALTLLPASVWAADAPVLDTGATAWMLTSTAFVLLMIPGLAMFYGGLVRSKNVLGTMMHSFAAMGIMTVLWVICGYSMAFGPNVLGGWFGWSWDYFFLSGIDETIMSYG